MQVTKIVLLLSFLSAFGIAYSEEADFCAIPRLVAGVPEVVQLPSIDKEFCGMALINNKFVKLADITERIEADEASCSTVSGSCKRMVRYFQKDASAPPYIIIFTGPKTKQGVESYFKTS